MDTRGLPCRLFPPLAIPPPCQMRVSYILLLWLCTPLLVVSQSHSPGLLLPLEDRLQQRASLTLNICESLVLTVPGIRILFLTLLSVTLNEAVCICLADGEVTAQSRTRIRTSLSPGGGNAALLPSLINLIGGTIEDVIVRLADIAAPVLGRDSTKCLYPINAVPDDCSSTCRYTCRTGMKLCNGLCVLQDDVCATGGTKNKRKLPIREDLRCAKGFEPCLAPYVSDSIHWSGRSYDCVDIKADLESCGGCIYPMPGKQAGKDCTAIPNVDAVSCIASECVVHSCMRGYIRQDTLSGPRCIPAGIGRRFG